MNSSEISKIRGSFSAKRNLVSAIDKLLDAKQDVGGLLSDYSDLAQPVEDHLTDAIDSLIAALYAAAQPETSNAKLLDILVCGCRGRCVGHNDALKCYCDIEPQECPIHSNERPEGWND